MKKSFVIIVLVLLYSCNTKKLVGTYNSTCLLYGKPGVKLELKANGQFQYDLRHVERPVLGVWERKGNLITLSSKDFIENDTNDMSPRLKYTDNPGKDVYKQKGSKLFIVNPNGLTKDCYLKKIVDK